MTLRMYCKFCNLFKTVNLFGGRIKGSWSCKGCYEKKRKT